MAAACSWARGEVRCVWQHFICVFVLESNPEKMSSEDGGKDDTQPMSQQLYPGPFSAASPCLPVASPCLPTPSPCLPVNAAAPANGGRNPRCARCSNHGVSVPLKGHKAYCTYRSCKCDKCQLVVLRRTIMAQQVAWRRRQDLDRLRQQQQRQQQMVMMMSKRRKSTSQNDDDKPGTCVSVCVCGVPFSLLEFRIKK